MSHHEAIEEKVTMIGLEDIRRDWELKNLIDWDMTPEEAVTLYLEWGNNWTHGKNFVKSKKDVSYYFVVNTWDSQPRIYLIRRNSDEAVELAQFELPAEFEKDVCELKGVYALEDDVKAWLKKELGV